MDSHSEEDIKKYTEQLAGDPKSRAFVPLADAYRKLGRYEEAISVAQEGVSKHPTYVAGKMALARALFENGDIDSAKEHLSWVLQFAPDNLMASKLMTEIERLAPSQAAPAPREQQPLSSPKKESPPPTETLSPTKTETLGDLYRQQGHLEEAKSLYADVGRGDKAAEVEVEQEKIASLMSPRESRLRDLLKRIRSRRRAA